MGGTHHIRLYGLNLLVGGRAWAPLLIAGLLCHGTSLAAATFTAALDRSSIVLGESANLALTFSGGEPGDVPTLPAIPGLQVAYAGRSSQINIFNAQYRSTVTHTFVVMPQRVGDYVIPALKVEVGGQILTSQPLQLKVLKAASPSPDSAGGETALAFLRLIAPKKTLYEGEVLVVQLQLLVRQGLRGVSQFQLTGFPTEGFNLGKIVEGPRQEVQIGNVRHTVFSWSAPLKALRTGKLTVGPATASVVVELPTRSRGRDPFFDQFGMRDPFEMFGGGEQRRVPLATDPVAVEVSPLPREGMPPAFTGAIGTYDMSVSAGPTNVAVGDPITVKVQITGRGALDALTLPEQSRWRDFKTYPPTSKVETTDPLGLEGTKTFEQVVVAEKADLKELPALSFAYFDPDRKEYRTLTHPAVPLVVRPAAAGAAPTIAISQSSTDLSIPPKDIVHIKPRMEVLAQASPPLIRRGWFLTLQAIPILTFAGALIWRKQVERLAANPRLRRRRLVAQIIREGLADLRRFAGENNSEEFFATVFRLLQDQIGERLDLPSSAITEAVIDEQLRPRGASESLLGDLQEIFQTCNLARYAPVKSSQELNALVPRLEAVLQKLQEVQL